MSSTSKASAAAEAEKVLGAGEGALTDLSTPDLKEPFGLKKAPVTG